jgi:hypothetical protein
MTLKEIEQELAATSIPTALSSPKTGIVLIVPKGQFDMTGAHHFPLYAEKRAQEHILRRP